MWCSVAGHRGGRIVRDVSVRVKTQTRQNRRDVRTVDERRSPRVELPSGGVISSPGRQLVCHIFMPSFSSAVAENETTQLTLDMKM